MPKYPERESEGNERKTGRKSTKSEGEELGSKAGKERKKESGGQREGRKSGQKQEYIRRETGSLGHRVNGSFGSSFTSGSPGHHFNPV